MFPVNRLWSLNRSNTQITRAALKTPKAPEPPIKLSTWFSPIPLQVILHSPYTSHLLSITSHGHTNLKTSGCAPAIYIFTRSHARQWEGGENEVDSSGKGISNIKACPKNKQVYKGLRRKRTPSALESWWFGKASWKRKHWHWASMCGKVCLWSARRRQISRKENPAVQPQGNVRVQTGSQSWQRREQWAAVALWQGRSLLSTDHMTRPWGHGGSPGADLLHRGWRRRELYRVTRVAFSEINDSLAWGSLERRQNLCGYQLYLLF